jgi:hypothetical protein
MFTGFFVDTAAAATAPVFTLKTATPLGCNPLSGSLFRGSAGADVENVQHFLVGQGLLATSSVSSVFDDAAHAAVVAFQLKQGLLTSANQLGAGIVGPKTAAAIKGLCPAPVTEKPASGSVSVTPREVYRKDARGETRVKYTFTATPAYGVATWRLTLSCTKDAVSTNRRDLTGCGDTTELKMGRSAKKNYTISYFNPWRATQMVTLRAEALSAEGKLLESTEAIVQVYPIYVREE